MESFLAFFETMPIWMKASWIVFWIVFFWILEGRYSLFKFTNKKWIHAKTNFSLLFFVMIINAGFGFLVALAFVWLSDSYFGLLNLFEAPVWLKLVISILVLDLITQYGVHFLLHKVRWMWRLHIVHHSDKKVDVTTGTRHHPFDFMIRETAALLVVIMMGMPLSFYLFYRILTILFTYFNHANVELPLKVDKAISLLIVSPNMHKFHHHYQLPWTDCNYGNVLSIWDRIFGTYMYGDPKKIQYGLDSSDHTDDESILVQLAIPFNKNVKSHDK
jgi:sterol desaturase/sphingolipid hydroxylase (fatty acid hydroxylase superfamily)